MEKKKENLNNFSEKIKKGFSNFSWKAKYGRIAAWFLSACILIFIWVAIKPNSVGTIIIMLLITLLLIAMYKPIIDRFIIPLVNTVFGFVTQTNKFLIVRIDSGQADSMIPSNLRNKKGKKNIIKMLQQGEAFTIEEACTAYLNKQNKKSKRKNTRRGILGWLLFWWGINK